MSLKEMMSKTKIKVSDLKNPKEFDIGNDNEVFNYLDENLGGDSNLEVKKIVEKEQAKLKKLSEASKKEDPITNSEQKESISKKQIEKTEERKEQLEKPTITYKRKMIKMKHKTIVDFTKKLWVGQYDIKQVGTDGVIMRFEYSDGSIKDSILERPKVGITLFGSRKKYKWRG